MPSVESGGIVTAIIDGQPRDVGDTVNVDIGGLVRTPNVGLSGNNGKFTTKPEAPEVEIEFRDGPTESMTLVRAIEGSVLQIAMRSGKTFMLYGAYQTGRLKLNVASGKYTGTFSGTDCLEITA